MYHYHDEVADTLADTVSHVATKSLEDDSLLTSAQIHTMQLLQNILNNDQMKEEAVKFVMRKRFEEMRWFNSAKLNARKMLEL